MVGKKREDAFVGKLNVRVCDSLAKPGMHGDGGTLYLNVAKGGSKSWIQRVRIDGRRRDIGLGRYPLVTLAEARDLAIDNRRAIRAGRNPLAEKRRRAVPTFREAAERTFEASKARMRSAKSLANWSQQLERHAMKTLGSLPVDQIGRAELLAVLSPIWTSKPEVGRKVRQRVRAVLAWAEAHGYVDRNLAGEPISGALPAQPAVKAHFRALPYTEVPAALELIAAHERSGAAARLALRLLVLTASRSGTVREAVWSEVNVDTRVWTIPGSRMKGGREHVVPLSDAALDVLREAEALRGGSDLIFPSPVKRGRPLSDMTLTKILRSLEMDGVTLAKRCVVHGFRTSFRTWASERTNAEHATMELALAHTVGDKVEQAYARSDLLEKRRRLMDQWALFATGGASGEVVPLHA